MALSVDLRGRNSNADRTFGGLVRAAGALVLVILALILITMTSRGWPAIRTMGARFFTSSRWSVPDGFFGAGSLIFGTVVSSVIALVIAVPVSLGVAMFVTQVAPRWMRRPVTYTLDLLAVVPSVVFGFWGIAVLAPKIVGFYGRVHDLFKGVPLLRSVFGQPNGRSFFTAGIILAIMITPIITSLSRDVMLTTPAGEREGALALGCTTWEMIRGAVIPHSKGGLVGAVMLGLGRAMGETIAVTLVIGSSTQVTSNLFASGNSMPAIIASEWGESSGNHKSALVALAVTLFLITVLVNIAATVFVSRSLARTRGA